ncbi:hypothetical protein [Aquimarina macrocephali]|uniref:hypothetical protein n=1 Tax=Aquimarina macrocephali TaxID=666563 RepID=UPI003F67C517
MITAFQFFKKVLIPKNSFLIFCFLLITQSCVSTKFNSVDKRACKKVEHNLEIISNFIFYSKENVGAVVDSSIFMGKISGHASEAGFQYSGQEPPTMNDYYTWTAWYTVNHNNIRYNKEKDEIYVVTEDQN